MQPILQLIDVRFVEDLTELFSSNKRDRETYQKQILQVVPL